MESEITTFIFDCFRVVLDPPFSKWYREKSEKHGFVDNELHDVFRQCDLGILSEHDVIERFSKYPGVTTPKDDIWREVDDHLRIDESLVEIIKKLRERKYKVSMLTNINKTFFERKVYPTYPEFKSLFDEIVISAVVGMAKPDAGIYLHTLEKVNSKPGECLFIDDSKPNVDAAIAVGMHGYLYTDSASFAAYLKDKGIEI